MSSLRDFKNHVVMFSGGLSSWATALKLSQMLPGQKIWLLFADTKIENPDLYRFLEEGARAIPNAELVKIANGRTPWEVFTDARFINHRAANCSIELKQKPCRAWIDACFSAEDTALHVGIDWTELDRLEGIKKGWAPYSVFSPLCEGDWWGKKERVKALKDAEIEMPELYRKSFLHNNCGGFCVRAGKKQFSQLLEHYPELFDEHAKQEQAFRDHIDNQSVGILRETRGGQMRIVSLADFRARGRQLPLIEETGTCGCFSLDDSEKNPDE